MSARKMWGYFKDIYPLHIYAFMVPSEFSLSLAPKEPLVGRKWINVSWTQELLLCGQGTCAFA